MSALRGIVFDLDNCLAATNEAGEALFEPAFAAMRAANRGRLSEAKLSAAFADCWFHALDTVAARSRSSGRSTRTAISGCSPVCP